MKKGETLTDIDLLAVKGNKAVVFQIKSKKLTSLARIGNVENLRKDFHNAVQEAYDQAIKCRDAILNQTAKLINSGGNEIKLDDSINDVYIICLTTDHYPAIAYQARAFLTKKPGNPNPITISIFDLDVLAYYLKDPFEFLYYLRQRVQLYDSFMGQNEVELLAYHLNQKLYPRKDEEGRSINFVLTEGMAQLIDAHFPSVRGDQPATKAMERLHSKWNNPEFQEIIEQLKKSNQSGFTDAIFYLYDLSGRGADQFIAEIKNLKKKCLEQRKGLRFHMASNEGRHGICYVCDFQNDGKLFRHVTEYCVIKKYQMKADLWLGFGAMADSKKNVELVMFSADPWQEDSQIEELSRKYYSKSRPMNLHTRQKLGRNDPCFCGSGFKFKKCHGK